MMLSRERLFLSQMISNSSGMLSYRSCSDKRVENSLSMTIIMSSSSLFALCLPCQAQLYLISKRKKKNNPLQVFHLPLIHNPLKRRRKVNFLTKLPELGRCGGQSEFGGSVTQWIPPKSWCFGLYLLACPWLCAPAEGGWRYPQFTLPQYSMLGYLNIIFYETIEKCFKMLAFLFYCFISII